MRKLTDRRRPPEPGRAPRAMAGRLGSGAAGAVAGRLAVRALRPAARRAAGRLGMPAERLVRVVEVAAPLTLSLAAARLARHRTRRPDLVPAGPPPRAWSGDEPPGAVRIIPAEKHPV